MIAASVIVASVIVVVIGLAWAASGLFGRPGIPAGLTGQAALALPFMAISAGVGLSHGTSLAGAVIASVSVLLALLVPMILPAVAPGGDERAAARAAAWSGGTVVSICLGALTLSWSASIIEFASDLNRTAVVLVLGVCAVLAAIGPGSCARWLRGTVFGSILAAAVMVAAAVVAGAPGTVTAPALATTSDGVLPGLLFAAALVVVGMGTPGVQVAAEQDRRGLMLAAIVMAAVTLTALGSLLALCGGWITGASYPMFVILGYLPPGAAEVIIAAMTLFAVAGVRRVLMDIAATDEATQRLIFSGRFGSARWRRTPVGVATILIVMLAILPVPQVLLAGVATAFAVISLFAARVWGAKSSTWASAWASASGLGARRQ
ncbi:MAG TPA: hypothetical protein PLK19_02635 [Mycobacterium sp.]|nr:hypothetical protein [Mycobacterium sp.]